MPLKLSLKPGERFVVNGAVLQNGDRRAVLLLQNKASILREKDIIQPEDANTPAQADLFPDHDDVPRPGRGGPNSTTSSCCA